MCDTVFVVAVELCNIIKALYNLSFVQALCVMSCKFTEEERIAWRSKAKEVCLTLKCLVFPQVATLYIYDV